MSRLMVGAGMILAMALAACEGQGVISSESSSAATATGPQGPQGPPGPAATVRTPELFQDAKWVSGDANGNAEVWTYCPAGARLVTGGANITGKGELKTSAPRYNNSNGKWLWVCRAERLPSDFAQAMSCEVMCELP